MDLRPDQVSNSTGFRLINVGILKNIHTIGSDFIYNFFIFFFWIYSSPYRYIGWGLIRSDLI